uniref:Noggin-like protein 5 n=1 Tax=Schmidtea mediterranea TaxID=79327 RepID=C1JAC5_SCHMD|nr:noggin-like protein 5 [Schmidtea mediterranea]
MINIVLMYKKLVIFKNQIIMSRTLIFNLTFVVILFIIKIGMSTKTTRKPITINLTTNEQNIVGVRFNFNEIIVTNFIPNLSPSIDKKLKKILDSDHLFDNWLALTKPAEIYIPLNGTNKIDSRLRNLIKMKNFVFKNKRGEKMNLTSDILDSIKLWLEEESSCQMEYIWHELEPSFWPRWIKKGLCVSLTSCSWPPGMSCKAKKTKNLDLLQFRCEEDPKKIKYDADERAMQQLRLTRQKRQYKIYNRKRGVFQGRSNNSRRVVTKREKEVRTKMLIFSLREYMNGFYCKWVKTLYYVNELCSCSC